MPLSKEPLLSYMSAKRIIQPTRTSKGARNSGPKFKEKVEPLFHRIEDQIKE